MADEAKEPETAPVIETSLKDLPDAIDAAVYLHNRWPLVVDPTGNATRFLKYQRGTFLLVHVGPDASPPALRRALVGGLNHGNWMTLDLGSDPPGKEITKLFDNDSFPAAVMNRDELFQESTWAPLLRPSEGDPKPSHFIPKDPFRLIVVTELETPPPETAALMCVVRVDGSPGRKGTDPVEQAYGIRKVKRQNKKLVDAGFDGDREELEKLLEQGGATIDIDSTDANGYTALSEAACNNHLEIVKFLLDLGADVNSISTDHGRTPLYRAAFNAHLDMCLLLLERGADPDIRSKSLELPADATRDHAVKDVLDTWDREETARLKEARDKLMAEKQNEMLQNAADKEAAAVAALRKDLVDLALKGDMEGVKDLLEQVADEGMREARRRPRVSAEIRDERGNTLLALACWHGHYELAKMLTQYYQKLSPTLEELEYKAFKVNVNARDTKGWTPVMLAGFHDHPKILSLLLEEGGRPDLRNSYNKTVFDLCKDKPAIIEVLGGYDKWAAFMPSVASDVAPDAAYEDMPAPAGAKKKKGTGTKKKATGRGAVAGSGSGTGGSKTRTTKSGTKTGTAKSGTKTGTAKTGTAKTSTTKTGTTKTSTTRTTGRAAKKK